MSLRETTRQILELVERASGCPILVTEDPSLKTLAAVRMARGDAPAHVIAYNPTADTQPDYLIAYQYGTRLVADLSDRLTDRFGRGFSTTNLW